MFNVEYYTLSLTDATNKYVDLPGVPVNVGYVAMDLIGGTAQELTGDFTVDGTRVRWDNTAYGLYSILATGDKLRVIYDRSL